MTRLRRRATLGRRDEPSPARRELQESFRMNLRARMAALDADAPPEARIALRLEAERIAEALWDLRDQERTR